MHIAILAGYFFGLIQLAFYVLGVICMILYLKDRKKK